MNQDLQRLCYVFDRDQLQIGKGSNFAGTVGWDQTLREAEALDLRQPLLQMIDTADLPERPTSPMAAMLLGTGLSK